jgi:hypothetical protein
MPPRATSLNLTWKPRNSLPDVHLAIPDEGKKQKRRARTDDEEHAERDLLVFRRGQEIGRKAEGKSNFGRLVEVCLEDMPAGMIKTGSRERKDCTDLLKV